MMTAAATAATKIGDEDNRYQPDGSHLVIFNGVG